MRWSPRARDLSRSRWRCLQVLSLAGCGAGLLLLGCAAASPGAKPRGNSPAESADVASAPAPLLSAATPVSSAPPSVTTAPPATTTSKPPALPVRELGVVTRSLERSVVSMALGKPRVAALVEVDGSVTPWLLEQDRWRAIPIPERLAVTAADLKTARIYFGRDDKPRIMGARQLNGEASQLYLRFRAGEWKVEKAEIARLAGAPAAAMFGLLGHADPEVVCKMGDQCIIKRLTGWQTMDAGPGAPRVDLQGKLAFAVYPESVAMLDGLKWRRISTGAELTQARGVWGDDHEYWISDASAGGGRLWHGSPDSWRSEPAPVSEPEQLWGTSSKDVWLAGASGLAHYDGTAWSQVAGVTAAVSEVFGRDDEVWAAGASGAWRIKRAGSGTTR